MTTNDLKLKEDNLLENDADNKSNDLEPASQPADAPDAKLEREAAISDQDVVDESQHDEEPVQEEPKDVQDEGPSDLAALIRRQLQSRKKEPKTSQSKKEQAKSPPKAEEPEPEPQPEQPEIDEEKIVSAAAKAAVMAIQQTKTSEAQQELKQTTSDQDILAALDETEKRRITVLQRMEQLYPDRYKGLSERYLKSLREAEEYATKWEQENPGEEWKDEEHTEELEQIAKKYKVDWDDEDYAEALADIRAEQRAAKLASELEQKITERQRREQEALKQQSVIAKTADDVIRETVSDFLKSVDLDVELYDENGNLNRDKLQELNEQDPIAYRALQQAVANGLAPLSMELLQLWRGIKQFDANDPAHKWLDQFIADQEKKIQQLPRNQRIHEGKDFMPLADWVRLPERERAKYWTLREEDAIALLRHHFASQAKKFYSEETAIAEKWMQRRAGKGSPRSKPGASESTRDRETLSPTTTTMPRGASRGRQRQDTSSDPTSHFLRSLLGE